jgi:hypothetical protein
MFTFNLTLAISHEIVPAAFTNPMARLAPHPESFLKGLCNVGDRLRKDCLAIVAVLPGLQRRHRTIRLCFIT